MSKLLVPIPKCDVSVRLATMDDIAFIDALQKTHRAQVGFMHLGTLKGKIEAKDVLVAWAPRPWGSSGPGSMGEAPMPLEERVGYVIGTDRYFKREDCGIIYHLNVVPGKQRGFVGATLLKAMFDKSAWGCRLFCCWCAQDIEANRFWESMGFVPLAFRAGSEKRSRVHIFWQKRIREGDTTTAWWFPSQTTGGAIGEGRIVLPIPPGTHWSDAKPMILPALSAVEGPGMQAEFADEPKRLPSPRKAKERVAKVVPKRAPLSGALCFAPPDFVQTAVAKVEKMPRACPEGTRREKKPRRKNDPQLVAAARELRDRWLEHVNSGAALIESSGKYDVSRTLSSTLRLSSSLSLRAEGRPEGSEVEGTRILSVTPSPDQPLTPSRMLPAA